MDFDSYCMDLFRALYASNRQCLQSYCDQSKYGSPQLKPVI